MLTIGSLFSGIGGLELGLEWAGLGPVQWQVEKDPYCRRVLAKHWPDVPRFADVTTVRRLPYVDLVCGGFPCQDVSAAGRGGGLKGDRSSLWWYFAAIVARVRPRFVVVENVASGARRWLPPVRRHLHVLGYDSTAYALAACDVGAPHLRKRIFVVAHSFGGALRLDEQRQPPGWADELPHEGQALPPLDGGAGPLADADGEGPLCVVGAGHGGGRRPGDGGAAGRGRVPRRAWAAEPEVGRVAHGVPDRLARLSALGNAVVPQCAEVIGHIILESLGLPNAAGAETR